MTTPAIVLVGPMGAGKSSIGRKLARALQVTFTDSDKIITRDHGAIADLFAVHGEEHYRELEREAVAEALARGGVVALGGGAVLSPQTRERLRAHHVVLLDVAPAVVHARIAGSSRPLLAGDDPIERWVRIRDERMPLYREVADREVDTSTGPISSIVDELARWARAALETTATPESPSETPKGNV